MFSANGINGDMNVTLWPLQVLHQLIKNLTGFPTLSK